MALKPGQVKFKHPDLGTTLYGSAEERDAVLGKKFTPVGVAPSTESVFEAEEGKVYDQVSGKLLTEEEAQAQAEATAKASEEITAINAEALEAQAAPPKSRSSKSKS